MFDISAEQLFVKCMVHFLAPHLFDQYHRTDWPCDLFFCCGRWLLEWQDRSNGGADVRRGTKRRSRRRAAPRSRGPFRHFSCTVTTNKYHLSIIIYLARVWLQKNIFFCKTTFETIERSQRLWVDEPLMLHFVFLWKVWNCMNKCRLFFAFCNALFDIL